MNSNFKRTRPSRVTTLNPSRIRLAARNSTKTYRGSASSAGTEVTGEKTATQESGPAQPPRENSSGGDALHLYLREIGEVKLLTPKEEIALARRIKRGDQEAREHMIKANLRLVVKIARDYEGLGLPLLDLINEGNLGLMKGVERFDPTKGANILGRGVMAEFAEHFDALEKRKDLTGLVIASARTNFLQERGRLVPDAS